jgi:hypothetical protein
MVSLSKMCTFTDDNTPSQSMYTRPLSLVISQTCLCVTKFIEENISTSTIQNDIMKPYLMIDLMMLIWYYMCGYFFYKLGQT